MSAPAVKIAAVITAAGSSTRMGTGQKKEYMQTGGRSVLERTLYVFLKTSLFTHIAITLPKQDIKTVDKMLSPLYQDFQNTKVILTTGGSSRHKSVYSGLKSLEKCSPDIVLIHDGARPYLSENLIHAVIEQTKQKGASIPVVPSVNAMKQIDNRGCITAHLERTPTVGAQTPQGFLFKDIIKAHSLADKTERTFLDDSEIFSEFIGPVWTVSGETGNIKITYKEDLQ